MPLIMHNTLKAIIIITVLGEKERDMYEDSERLRKKEKEKHLMKIINEEEL